MSKSEESKTYLNAIQGNSAEEAQAHKELLKEGRNKLLSTYLTFGSVPPIVGHLLLAIPTLVKYRNIKNQINERLQAKTEGKQENESAPNEKTVQQLVRQGLADNKIERFTDFIEDPKQKSALKNAMINNMNKDPVFKEILSDGNLSPKEFLKVMSTYVTQTAQEVCPQLTQIPSNIKGIIDAKQLDQRDSGYIKNIKNEVTTSQAAETKPPARYQEILQEAATQQTNSHNGQTTKPHSVSISRADSVRLSTVRSNHKGTDETTSLLGGI